MRDQAHPTNRRPFQVETAETVIHSDLLQGRARYKEEAIPRWRPGEEQRRLYVVFTTTLGTILEDYSLRKRPRMRLSAPWVRNMNRKNIRFSLCMLGNFEISQKERWRQDVVIERHQKPVLGRV